MSLKKLTWLVLVASAGVWTAHVSARNELFGAGPIWIESEAIYAGSMLQVAPSEESCDSEEAEDPPKEPLKEPERGRETTFSDPKFPCKGEPQGLDAFLRSALVEYRVRPGDTLSRIGKNFQVPHRLLANMNGIENSKLLAGSAIRIVRGPFHVLVLREERKLRLYCNRAFIEEYGVAVGKKGHETALGEFLVRTKMANPAWTDPDSGKIIPFGTKANPLGTRWIGLSEGIGIHGTWDEESIGKKASRGCIRMRNRDVEELFDLLVRRKSVVRIVDRLKPEAEEGEGKNSVQEEAGTADDKGRE